MAIIAGVIGCIGLIIIEVNHAKFNSTEKLRIRAMNSGRFVYDPDTAFDRFADRVGNLSKPRSALLNHISNYHREKYLKYPIGAFVLCGAFLVGGYLAGPGSQQKEMG